jgi:hypothetical protein
VAFILLILNSLIMRKFLVVTLFVFPFLFIQGQSAKPRSADPKKVHAKVISPSKLPEFINRYISTNLPNAKITKAIKQRRSPGAKYIVHVEIKTKHHTLIFNKDGGLVNLDGKKITTATDSGK